MGKFLFMPMVLQQMAREIFFRKICASALRLLAVVAVFAGLTGFVHIWNYTVKQQGSQIPGCVIFILLFAVAVYMVVHTLLIRAGQLLELPETEFGIVSIASVFLRLGGELYASIAIPIAVGGGIFIWFGREDARYFIRSVTPMVKGFGDGTFLGGIEFMLGGVFCAFFVLLLSYLLAELLEIMLKLAMGSKATRQHDETGE